MADAASSSTSTPLLVTDDDVDAAFQVERFLDTEFGIIKAEVRRECEVVSPIDVKVRLAPYIKRVRLLPLTDRIRWVYNICTSAFIIDGQQRYIEALSPCLSSRAIQLLLACLYFHAARFHDVHIVSDTTAELVDVVIPTLLRHYTGSFDEVRSGRMWDHIIQGKSGVIRNIVGTDPVRMWLPQYRVVSFNQAWDAVVDRMVSERDATNMKVLVPELPSHATARDRMRVVRAPGLGLGSRDLDLLAASYLVSTRTFADGSPDAMQD